jgi:hypothetical protein
MKTRESRTRRARHPCQGRKIPPAAPARRIHWIGQMVIGIAPRWSSLEAANDPQA